MSGQYGHTSWKGVLSPQERRARRNRTGFELSHDVKEPKPAHPDLLAKVRRETVELVRRIFRGEEGRARPLLAQSDPFMEARMVAHAKVGILEKAHLLPRTKD